jgi:conjugative transfer signal peptidase TraF
MKSRYVVLGFSALALAAIGSSSAVGKTKRFVYNPTASAPLGWYRVVTPNQLQVNDVVLVRLPFAAARLADQRHYLRFGVPILKRIGAVSPQSVCINNGRVLINEMTVARTLKRDGAGRLLMPWTQCRSLSSDELFLLSTTHPASFDSRYFGPVSRQLVIGRAIPIWTW